MVDEFDLLDLCGRDNWSSDDDSDDDDDDDDDDNSDEEEDDNVDDDDDNSDDVTARENPDTPGEKELYNSTDDALSKKVGT